MSEFLSCHRFGDCELDLARRELRVGGQSQDLEPKVFDLLAYLLESRDRVVSHDELMDALWPEVIVTEAALARTIMKARKAVGDDARRQAVIKTLSKRGYRFVAELETAAAHNEYGEPLDLSPVRFAKSDELHIAWRSLGENGIDILFVPGFVSHLDIRYRIESVASFDQQLARNGRLITFDKRGVGLSDRIAYAPKPEQIVADMLAVLDAAASEKAVLFGVSESGPTAALFATRYPERTRALIMYGSFAKGTRDEDHPWGLSRQDYDAWLDKLIAGWGGPSSLEYFAPSLANDPEAQEVWARYLRGAATPTSIRGILETLRDVDMRATLARVQTPSLILHRQGDRIAAYQAGEDMAKRIPQAQFRLLPGDDHWWFLGDSDSIIREIEQFLRQLGN